MWTLFERVSASPSFKESSARNFVVACLEVNELADAVTSPEEAAVSGRGDEEDEEFVVGITVFKAKCRKARAINVTAFGYKPLRAIQSASMRPKCG